MPIQVIVNRMSSSAIVGAVVTVAEVVALSRVWLMSDEFPIDLIQRIALKNDRGDYSLAWCGFHSDFKLSKHDVEITLNLWS